jgi:hypothetical protein
MDPLDQRLTDAGLAWRRTQPEPPDLDRMVVALRRHRSGLFQGRLMFAFVATLLLAAAIAVAPGVGSFLQGQNHNPSPVVPASPSSTPGQPSARPSLPVSPKPSPSVAASERQLASDLVDRYESALVAGKWQTAFDLLAPTSLTHDAGFASFEDERAAFFDSVNGRYTLSDPKRATDWASYGPLTTGADRTKAWLIQVDYPALAGNNAGFEQFVVAPDASGTLRIWPVR